MTEIGRLKKHRDDTGKGRDKYRKEKSAEALMVRFLMAWNRKEIRFMKSEIHTLYIRHLTTTCLDWI